ncbi:phosphatase PAP2 family protein [Streptomyces sp. CB01881]|uniref:phosphatase PAP2 family protein n=1 Tax=Streptomyces sp. CB01881 TaxID=2078691 RepID=UPI001F4F54D5|nr:phosphatase PAP2 family protein [Streptomyces sp. CB01881]
MILGLAFGPAVLPAAATLPVTVGWSRLVLKAHTPAQVLAGTALGGICALVFLHAVALNRAPFPTAPGARTALRVRHDPVRPVGGDRHGRAAIGTVGRRPRAADREVRSRIQRRVRRHRPALNGAGGRARTAPPGSKSDGSGQSAPRPFSAGVKDPEATGVGRIPVDDLD